MHLTGRESFDTLTGWCIHSKPSESCCRKMLYYQTIYPEHMAGELLDRFLAAGWYRIGQSVITTDLITHDEFLVPVFWLRLRLSTYRPSGSARRIRRRCAHLETRILPFAITPEIEALYARYRESISHTISPSVHEYLLDAEWNNVFDSRLIEVRDGGRLVAAGYFDVGARCSTGILHIYEPGLAQLSLGNFLPTDIRRSFSCGRCAAGYPIPGWRTSWDGGVIW